MYESFRCDVLTSLQSRFSPDDLQIIAAALDTTAQRYTFHRQSTDLAVDGRAAFFQAVQTFFAVRFTEGMARTSLKTEQSILRNFTMAQTVPLEQLTPNHIRAYLYTYQQQHSISSRTLELYRTVICGFLKWAHSEDYIPKDITANLKPIHFVPAQRHALTQLQLERVRRACRTPREQAIVEVLYSTGCRVSEFCRIQLRDIDWERKCISVVGKGNKPRTVYITARAEVAIRAYLDARRSPSPYLISGEKGRADVTPSAIQRIFGILADRAGIPRSQLSPHILRHTMATQALTGSTVEQVQQMLGHSSIATTMIYAEVDKSSIQAAHRRSVI